MAGYVFHRAFHHLRIVHHRSHTDFLDKLVPALSLSVRPVVDIQERIPSEERGVRTLFDIWFEASGVELAVVRNRQPVFLKPVLPVLQNARRAARKQQYGSSHQKY